MSHYAVEAASANAPGTGSVSQPRATSRLGLQRSPSTFAALTSSPSATAISLARTGVGASATARYAGW